MAHAQKPALLAGLAALTQIMWTMNLFMTRRSVKYSEQIFFWTYKQRPIEPCHCNIQRNRAKIQMH
jgi:hypothetical protein